jgi:hypothetical protein
MRLERPPFRGLTLRQWLNLLWAALFSFYISFAGWYVATGSLCDHMGADYRAFYASAQIARDRGFAQVYDLRTQDAYQRPLYDQCYSGPARVPYVPVPMPYLPAFVLLFMPMLPLSFMASYFVWIFVNLGLIVLYMFRFKRALGPANGSDIMAQLLVCLPIFSNFFLGQVNGWLLICLAEFMLASIRGKDFRAGLWLVGLLVKPQTLVLILPGLLLSRRFRALAGFAVSCVALAGVCLLLAGGYGLGDLAILILHYVRGLPTNAPEAMMNWRAVAFNLSNLVPQNVAWAISMGGLMVTAGVGLSLWVRPSLLPERLPLILFGTYAATCAATWHSHVHMVLPLIPLVLYLYAKGQLPWKIAYVWLLGPSVLFPLMLVISPDSAYPFFGLSMLALNMFLVTWTLSKVWEKPAAEAPPAPLEATSE